MANKDYVNPYAALAQYHKDGLDYIATNWTGTETEEDLVEMVYDYIVSVFTESLESLEAQVVFKGIIANAINGYLNYGHSINPELRSEPVQFMDQYFARVEENLRTAATIQSSTNDNQMTLAIGKASFEYWKYQVDNSGTSDWTTYLTGNVATDLNDIPYWVTAAMFGSRYSFGQVNSNSGDAMVTIVLTTLAGSLVVSAGKILFKWVPKVNACM